MSDVVERLWELLAKATPHWQIYSEPDVGLPPSLFGGAPGPTHEGFGPLEPLDLVDLHLAVEAINALPALLDEILSLRAQLASMGDAVAAERERCARVAEGECENQIAAAKVIMGLSDDFADEGVCVGAAQCAHRIAAAIREGG